MVKAPLEVVAKLVEVVWQEVGRADGDRLGMA